MQETEHKNYITIVGTGAQHIGIKSSIDVKLDRFNNNEAQIQLCESVRHHHVVIIQSFNDPDKHFMELMMIIDAVKRSMAASVTVIAPIFPYARQDRKADSGTPISARVICDMLSAANINRFITIDLHATQIQGFMNNDIGFEHVSSSAFLAHNIRTCVAGVEELCICSPDAGGVKRAKKLRALLGAKFFCMIDKTREVANKIAHMAVIGDVRGKHVLIVDDMIDTAGTLAAAVDVLMKAGALSVAAVATHGLFNGKAFSLLAGTRVFTTDTMRIDNPPHNVTVFDMKPFIKDIIRRIEYGDHFSDLFKQWDPEDV